MKKYLYSTLLMLLCTVTGAFAQSMTISGGNDGGIVICAQGYLYAWGANKNNRLGLEAPNESLNPVSSPTKVNTGNLTFSQVTAGSGSHFVALSCRNVVYAWGGNDQGQTGKPCAGSDDVLDTPSPVLCGEAPGYELNGDKGGIYLGGVKFVAASTSGSFALLETGEVVGWGGNGDYGGGQWTNEPLATMHLPRYIVDENGDRIKNVVHIAGGDNNALFVVDDDGDGLGDVYSIGNYNGRVPGLSAQQQVQTKEYTAGPVLTEDGLPLTNIRMATVSDVGGFAVDGVTGYVYTWGNGARGCMQTLKNSQFTSVATKALSGEYQTISGETFLTDVVQVIGGQGYGAAITKEGYMLYWGNNGEGGVVPSPTHKGGNTCDTGPVFCYYEDGSIVDNAVALGRGDVFGYMVNDNYEYFAWGDNRGVGATGLGSKLAIDGVAKELVQMVIPCETPDICPEAYMIPSVNKCPGETVDLHSGFVAPTGNGKNGQPLKDRYFFSWYYRAKNEKDWKKLLNTSTKLSSVTDRRADIFNNSEVSVSEPGWYKVEIEYIDANVPCNACSVSIDSIEVIDMDMPIDTIITDLNCVANPDKPSAGDKISFEAVVNDKFYKATDNVTFAAFSTPTSTDTIRIVKTTGAGGKILLPNISGDSVLQVNDNAATTGDTTYSIWVEDISMFETKLLETKTPTTCSSTWYGNQTQIINLMSPAILKSFSIFAMGTQKPQEQDGVITQRNEGTITITPILYAGGEVIGTQYVVGREIWRGTPQPFTLFQPDGVQECVVECDYELTANSARGTQYVLCMEIKTTNNPAWYTASVGGAGSDIMYSSPVNDSNGYGIQAVGSSKDQMPKQNANRDNPFWNITFGKLTDYDCGRIELQARLGCPPCNSPDPTTVKIEVSDPAVTDTIFLCQESPAVTLSVKNVKAAPSAEAGATFDILWYKNSLASVAVLTEETLTSSMYPASIAWDAAKAGTTEKIYLQVRDHKEPNGECHEEDSIVIKYNEIPKTPAIAVPSFCENAAVTDKPVITSILGNSFDNMTLQWWADDAMSASSTAPDFSTLAGSATEYPFYYNIIDANNCASPVDSFLVEVYVKPIAPTVKNLDFVVTLNTIELVEQGATVTTGHTLTWYDDANKSSYPAQGSSASPTVTLDAEKNESFWVAQISDIGGCISDTVRIDVTVNDAPVPDAVNDTVCLGISVDVTKLVTVGDQRNPNDRYVPVWYNDFGANKEDSVSASAVMMDPNNPGEQLFYVAQKNLATGAISNKKTFAVYVYGVYKPTVDKSVINYCAKDPATVLTANQMKNENDGYMADDFVWTLDGRGVNSPLPDTDVTNDTSYTYRVHQIYTIPTDQNQVCVGDSVEVTVNVTHVPQLTVGSVLYLKSDANASGSFDNNLMQQNTGLITGNMEQGATLNWYESVCATPGPGTPTPTVDSSIPTGVDQNVTYCVSQTVNGCEGEKIKVDVKISDAMPPTVEHLI
ncbi:MAG: hypothetical protein IKY58_01825, partial [Paludibacteraceae bacterium]|nr:hypothetical protein [Paludibacteraceae bacterium]